MAKFSPGDKVYRRLSTGAPVNTSSVWTVIETLGTGRVRIRLVRAGATMLRSVNPGSIEHVPEEEL